jgi:hypothetical protein
MNFVRVNVRLMEFARRNVIVEEKVQFRVGPAFRFRETEVCPNEAQEKVSGSEKGRLRAPVPGRRIQHVQTDDAGIRGPDNVVGVSREYNCLLS